jgi:phosphohistidine swiveling domain-containing protein
MNLTQALKEKWYTQGSNSTPLLLGAAGNSCATMKKPTGIAYRNFLYVFKGTYSDMNYSLNDLEGLSAVLEERLKKDKEYFIKTKKVYDSQINKSNEFYKKIDKMDLGRLDIKKLEGLAKKGLRCIDISVGIAHIIEPFSLVAGIKIKKELADFIKDQHELNSAFILLTTPAKESFARRYEKMLRQIKEEKDRIKRNSLIENVLKEFFWVRNSYAGRHILSRKEILEEIDSLKEEGKPGTASIEDEKKMLAKKLGLPPELLVKLKAIEFMTYWQDERKENILKAIDYTQRVLEALAKRIGLDVKYLLFSSPPEMELGKISSTEFQKELIERSKCCVYLFDLNKPIIISGEKCKTYIREYEKERHMEVEEITGITASSGTVVGTARVCTSIESIKKVEKGNILVASMTRPEYLPAMKKAAAIVTDEGGITCHAAIVSRELGIPCIIGTKIATKVLKDNMLVEVNANHGLVKIIKE